MSARELPKIDVAGELYYIDLRLNEFRHVNDFMNRIFIDDDLHENDDRYLLAYDKVHKCVFRGEREEFDARKDNGIVIVELPSLEKRALTTLLRFADQHTKWMEENRLKKQKAMRPLLEKNRVRKSRGRKL
jgi:hypothetical protein